jgi:hypothetical protein
MAAAPWRKTHPTTAAINFEGSQQFDPARNKWCSKAAIKELQHMQGSRYAKWPSWVASLPILFSLAACASSSLSSSVEYANKKAAAEGSPFQWKSNTVPGGTMLVRTLADLPSGPSRADPILKQDFRSSAQGGTDIGISKPQSYQKD